MADQKLAHTQRRFFGVVQPAGAAGGAGGLRAGARLHDRAAVRLGAVGKHHGGARSAFQGDRARERGVSVVDSAQLHRQGKVARGGIFARAGGGDARRRRKTGRAAGDPADVGDDHRACVCEVDSVVPRPARADQSVEQRGALGTAHASCFCARSNFSGRRATPRTRPPRRPRSKRGRCSTSTRILPCARRRFR